MVALGKVSGVTSSGMGRQQIGALEKASFEKAMDIFKEAAGFGEKKSVSSVSASIYLGKTAEIGTGYSDTFIDTSTFKDIEEEIDLNPDMKIDIGSFKDAIGEMTDIVSGAGTILMEGLENEMFGIGQPTLPGGTVLSSPLPPSYVKGIKGPIIKSKALDQAVVNLEQIKSQPCDISIGPTKAEDVKLSTLPTQVAPSKPLGVVTGLVPSIPLLPALIKPKIPTILPSTVDIPIPSEPIKSKVMFNLDDFIN